MSQGTRHSEDWRRGRARLLHAWTGDIKAMEFLCWGSLLGGTMSSSLYCSALWINGFKEQELWPFYRKLRGKLVRTPGLTGMGCAGIQARQRWVHWSCPLQRDFGPSTESLWCWEHEWSERGVCLTLMCPLCLILFSLKMALSVWTHSLGHIICTAKFRTELQFVQKVYDICLPRELLEIYRNVFPILWLIITVLKSSEVKASFVRKFKAFKAGAE